MATGNFAHQQGGSLPAITGETSKMIDN